VSPGEIAAIVAAALTAGAINTVVGAGSLITFPVLLAFGYPPLLANVSNNVGLVPGNLTGTYGYRADLTGQGWLLRRLIPAALAGGLSGAAALLLLPPGAFKHIVPVLILIACVLVFVQPLLADRVKAGRTAAHERISPVLWICAFAAGAYGGYFGAAQGVLMFGLLGLFLGDSLQRVNAAKNVLVMTANLTAAVVFVAFAHIAWLAAGLIAAGSAVGGLIGARIGQRLPAMALRVFIVAVGVIAVVKLIFFP
jgi:uncharacterized membrane protein YfcA